jgi:hypothetical protein
MSLTSTENQLNISRLSSYPQCQKELQSVVESWILVKLKLGHTIPVLDDIDLNLNLQAVEVA